MNIYTVALKKIVEDKKYRLERDYDNKVLGISQIPFCLEKMVLEYRYKRPIPVNGQMFIGTVLHRHLFKDIIKTTYSMFDRIFLEFEKEIQFVADDYKLVGHVDCYDKRRKIVYEFKTTDNEHVMNTSLASAYQFQANCYVGILGARSYEIIILHRRFIDINDSVGVIKGEFDEEKYK